MQRLEVIEAFQAGQFADQIGFEPHAADADALGAFNTALGLPADRSFFANHNNPRRPFCDRGVNIGYRPPHHRTSAYHFTHIFR